VSSISVKTTSIAAASAAGMSLMSRIRIPFWRRFGAPGRLRINAPGATPLPR
jgi:hypothetical protein